MPGALGYGWHESNRGEYLAQFFLSALGVSAPVIRQEDIGVDFYCALARNENNRLTFHSPFMVQHGSDDGKDFVFGGYKDGKWMGYSIEWLFSQELPLFVCTTNRKEARFKLYSTSAMWLSRYTYPSMTMVRLCPDQNHNPIENVRQKDRIEGPPENGDGYTYHVPLGAPLLELTVESLDDEMRKTATAILEIAIAIEQANITFRRIGVHKASWFDRTMPNAPDTLKQHGGGVFWRGGDSSHVEKQIETLRDVLQTLSLNLRSLGRIDELNYIAPSFRLFHHTDFPEWMLKILPEECSANLR